MLKLGVMHHSAEGRAAVRPLRALRDDRLRIDALAGRLFGGISTADERFDDATKVVEAVLVALKRDDGDVALSGFELGAALAHRQRERGAHFAHTAAGADFTQVETLLTDLTDDVDEELQARARELIARFIRGYIAGIYAGDAAWGSEFTAVLVRRLGTARSTHEIAQVAVDAGKLGLGAQATWVSERRDDEWAFVAHRGLDVELGTSGLQLWSMLTLDGLASGESLVFDGFSDAPAELAQLAHHHGLTGALLLPIMIEGLCEGMVGFARRDGVAFAPRDIALADILSAQISARLRELRAQARSREALAALQASERVAREQLRRKERAVDILQNAFIPRALPYSSGLRFDALYLPADDESRVGGDWYDVFALDDGQLVFSVGDVAGHGLDAAVTMGLVRQAIVIAATQTRDPAAILAAVNQSLLVQRLSITTAIVGIYEATCREARYACAGHPPPILSTPALTRSMPVGGIPLGVEATTQFPTETVRLTEGTALLLYTDALIEHTRDIVLGTERLVEVVRQVRATDEEPENWATRIADEVLDGAANDDLAILAIRALPRTRSSGLSSVQTHRDTIAWDFQSADIHAIALARNHFIRFLTPLVLPESDTLFAEVVLGELLSNAVEHAPGPVHVELGWEGMTPTVTVRDRGPGGLKDPALPENPYEQHGRGLFLVWALSERVATQRLADGGTSVTAWLPLVCSDHLA